MKARQDLLAKGVHVELVWKGPLREDDREQQVQVVESFASQGIDGIVLAPLDSQALVRPVLTALQSKVPVVIIDSGLKTDKYVSFVATDNLKGGQLAGEHLDLARPQLRVDGVIRTTLDGPDHRGRGPGSG